MTGIKVNGQIGTVQIPGGSQITLTFEGFNGIRYLFDIVPSPDVSLYEGTEDTITLQVPTYRTQIILRAYDYCVAGICYYSSNDIIINVYPSGGSASASCLSGNTTPVQVGTFGEITCLQGYTPDIIDPGNPLLFKPPYGACVCDNLSAEEISQIKASGRSQYAKENPNPTDWTTLAKLAVGALILIGVLQSGILKGGKK